MMRKKIHFTLLEIVIGLVLVGFLFGMLSTHLWNLRKLRVQLQNIHSESFENTCCYLRLDQVFENLCYEKSEKSSDFFTEPSAQGILLHFTYDNGCDHDSKFSGIVSATLSLNSKNELCLVTIGKNQASRQEILYEKMKHLELKFFDGEQQNWQESWAKEKKYPPALVKVFLTMMNREGPVHQKPMAFLLPQQSSSINYRRNGK